MSARLPRAVSTTLGPHQLDVLDALAFVSGYTGRGARGRCAHEIVAAALEEAERDESVQLAIAAVREARGRHPANGRHLRSVP